MLTKKRRALVVRASGAVLMGTFCLTAVAAVAISVLMEAEDPLIDWLLEARDGSDQTSSIDGAYQQTYRQTYKHLSVVAIERFGEDGKLLGGACHAEVMLPTLKTRAHALILEKNARGHVREDDVSGVRLALLGVTRSELNAVRRSCRFPSEVRS